jgi:DNA-binding XRE family transcriptional regulator
LIGVKGAGEVLRHKISSGEVSLMTSLLDEVVDLAGAALPGSDVAPPYSETEFLSELGQRLRSSRLRLDLSRRELARRSGISERYIAQIEAGKGNVSIILLLRLSSAIHAAQVRPA